MKNGVSLQVQKQEARVTVGTDPEFFLRDKDTKEWVPAIGIVTGTKDEPEILKCGSNLQYDNVALEFATLPAIDGNDMIAKIKETFMEVRSLIPAHLEIIAEPSAEFSPDALLSEEAQAFGCMPDISAWSLMDNDPPSAKSALLRSCGGHIHVGHVPGSKSKFLLDTFGKVNMIRMMDAFHGITSVVLDSTPSSVMRRELYGKAGSFRSTSYGVEYRVLSNFWLTNPVLVTLVDSLTQDAVNYMKNYTYDEQIELDTKFTLLEDIGHVALQDIINFSKEAEARVIVDTYLNDHMSALTRETLFESLDIIKTNNNSIEQNWGLK